MASDCLAWLNNSSPSQSAEPIQTVQAAIPAKIVSRRASVIGSSLFAVSDQVRETGSDYLARLPRASSSFHDAPTALKNTIPIITNNFDPFRRGNTIPFALGGRKRIKSLDSVWRPTLQTIAEHNGK